MGVKGVPSGAEFRFCYLLCCMSPSNYLSFVSLTFLTVRWLLTGLRECVWHHVNSQSPVHCPVSLAHSPGSTGHHWWEVHWAWSQKILKSSLILPKPHTLWRTSYLRNVVSIKWGWCIFKNIIYLYCTSLGKKKICNGSQRYSNFNRRGKKWMRKPSK